MWLQVPRNDRVQEYFFKGAYIQSDTWNDSKPPGCISRYPYIKDGTTEYDLYNRMNFVTKEIRVSEITHVTKCENTMSILEDGGFRSGEKIIPGFELFNFVWFGMKIEETEIINIKEHFKLQALQHNTNQFASSPAFQPKSRYGNFKFTFGIQDVIDAYRSQYCQVHDQVGSHSEPEFRKLGTFAYKQEVMHVVLVCPSGTLWDDSCPLLSSDLTPLIEQDIPNPSIWIWRPHSTRIEYGYQHGSRRWEHVTFAFHVPEGDCFRLKNLEHHLSLCLGVDIFRGFQLLGVNEAINEMIGAIQSIPSMFKRKILFNVLIRMMRGYLDEESLYETLGNEEYESLWLRPVCDASREVLQGEDFDWWPLIEWMKSVKHTQKNQSAHQIIFEYLSTIVQTCVPQIENCL